MKYTLTATFESFEGADYFAELMQFGEWQCDDISIEETDERTDVKLRAENKFVVSAYQGASMRVIGKADTLSEARRMLVEE